MMGHRIRIANRMPRAAQSGSVLVELAAILPILIGLSLCTLEFASALSEYRSVVNQARIATRYLSTKAPGEGHEQARCLAINGIESGAPCGGTPIRRGFSDATVVIQDASNAPATHRAQAAGSASSPVVVNLVTVQISNYEHPLVTGTLVSGMIGDRVAITFSPIRVTMRQAL